ncbi:hypothetical protein ASZ78_012970 [Callipepla squamata]|uniref:DOMON domain-containing protein n=1 Tax=Callipepla squamata TaxID=9009 RepID=A0A226NF79_CALSU|nr:hypothetical protein ASZ78_012970 [Callipepla squamata]
MPAESRSLFHVGISKLKMELPGLAFAVWMFICFCVSVDGYPNGKVREACASMIPCHGSSPQLSPMHVITVNGTEFKPGDSIEVQLSGPDFEGFFIQARNAEDLDSPAVGSFVLADQRRSQLLTCGRTMVQSSISKWDFNASGCGNTKFCLRNPPNCDPENASCFFLSFHQEGRSVLIEMSGASEGYLSFALSYDQWMGDDDAYLCINEDHHVSVSTAYLKGRSPPVLDSKNALEDVSWRLVDGVLQCSFRRNISLPTYKERFNMNASYYIFLADGEASEGGLIYKHRRQPLITDRMYNVTGIPQDIGGSRSPRLIKAHGALMFIAWISTVSIGVVVARFFKPVWSHSFLFGKEIWFQESCGVSKYEPFFPGASYAYVDHRYAYKHFFCIAFYIPRRMEQSFRPSPHAPRRQLFNWFHWSIGTTARILAVELIEDDRVQILQSLTSAEAEGNLFKQIVLTIYVCGNIIFLIAFLAAINQI